MLNAALVIVGRVDVLGHQLHPQCVCTASPCGVVHGTDGIVHGVDAHVHRTPPQLDVAREHDGKSLLETVARTEEVGVGRLDLVNGLHRVEPVERLVGDGVVVLLEPLLDELLHGRGDAARSVLVALALGVLVLALTLEELHLLVPGLLFLVTHAGAGHVDHFLHGLVRLLLNELVAPFDEDCTRLHPVVHHQDEHCGACRGQQDPSETFP